MGEKYDSLVIPTNYSSILSIKDTQTAIKLLKDYFEVELAKVLKLTRVSAPLFVRPETGFNDNLNGVERPVTFDVKGIDGSDVEIVHSLAKWKRWALKRYNFCVGEGLYTDMNAIRRDEDLDNLHSVYVDQWDWELILGKENRNTETLKNIVNKIYMVLKNTEKVVRSKYPTLPEQLPDKITFITTQELEDMYPNLSPKERENAISKEKGAVFLMKIGGALKSGKRHDGRAPDYDDWELNGDILLWYSVLDTAFELSSMGIRVDKEALAKQLKITGCEERSQLKFHKDLLAGQLPETMGGGIGQSRLCMFFLGKAHIGEVQVSVWPDDMVLDCEAANIELL